MSPVAEFAGVDVLSDVLQSLGVQTRLFCHSALASPWCLAFPSSSLAHFHYVEHGGAWVRMQETGKALALAAGDLVVLAHGKRYQVADAPKRAPIPFERTIPQGRPSCSVVRNGGNGPTTSMLCGAFSMKYGEGHPLLSLLPEMMLLRPTDSIEASWVEGTLRQLAAEVREQRPGNELVVSRLTDILLVQVLRAWLSDSSKTESNWLGAMRDPQVGRAMSLMHAHPEHAWTVKELASRVGLSRSPFAARFVRLTGESPMAYLNRVRMQKAAGLLRTHGVSLANAAAAIGYQSEAAFSKAFRRHYGSPPGQFRKAG